MCTEKGKTMNQRSYTFIIPGDPTPLARCRYGKGKFYDTQKNLKLVWGIHLRNQVPQELIELLPLHDQAIILEVIFHFKIPHCRINKSLEGLPHIFRPDTSNLLKFVEDAATTILFNDDCILSDINAKKRYSANPRTEFTIQFNEDKKTKSKKS
jgi:Holliday junction resolvase RusA-like endonuclease